MSDQAHYSGGWSDWIPTDDPTRFYRARQDETGAYQYEYSQAAPPAVDPAVPRGDDSSLETAFGNVSLNDPYAQYQYNQAYTQGYGYTSTHGGASGAGVATASGGHAQHYDMSPPQVQSSRKGKAVDTGPAKSKKSARAPGKEQKKSSSSKKQNSSSKRHEEPRDPFYSAPSEVGSQPAGRYQAPGIGSSEEAVIDEEDQYQQEAGYFPGGPDPTYAPQGIDAHTGTGYPAQQYGQEFEQSGHRSHHQSKKHSKQSSSGKQKQTSSSYHEEPEDEELNEVIENSDAYQPGAGGYPEEEDPGTLTPRATSPVQDPAYYYQQPPSSNSSYSSGSGSQYAANAYPSYERANEAIQGDGDSYDDRYVIEQSSRFMPGEVFKILWSEPKGGRQDGGRDLVSVEEISHEEYESMGHKFYTGFRRFVIVANDFGHCTCVPVLTYERRACTKKGVKAEKHGIVYPIFGRPQMLPKEPKLGFEPVRLELDYHTERLAKESRINYSKLVTVEHNVSVFFIGRIVAEDFDIVQNAVDKCWSEKRRDTGPSDSSHHRRRPRH
ncbi:hypothetical protein QBC39DRAFT_370247 [Podospora conica]|nr:hypothetical protein QBC39DRAFT_370247 [Schizothecium conicum]